MRIGLIVAAVALAGACSARPRSERDSAHPTAEVEPLRPRPYSAPPAGELSPPDAAMILGLPADELSMLVMDKERLTPGRMERFSRQFGRLHDMPTVQIEEGRFY